MNINQLWDKIKMHEGELFKTKTKLPFTYIIENGRVVIERNGKKYIAKKSDFQFVLENPNEQRHVYRDQMRVSSYVLGIINDGRIGALKL